LQDSLLCKPLTWKILLENGKRGEANSRTRELEVLLAVFDGSDSKNASKSNTAVESQTLPYFGHRFAQHGSHLLPDLFLGSVVLNGLEQLLHRVDRAHVHGGFANALQHILDDGVELKCLAKVVDDAH
jgi:hypothetical protein